MGRAARRRGRLAVELVRGITLIAATITMGLIAGLFYAFAQAIMPGLGQSDDRTFVAGFQAIDKAINNPWQAAGFVGAPVFTSLAAALHLGPDDRSSLAWIVAALVLFGVVLAITFRVHLPLNDEIQAAGESDHIVDLAAVRERFESKWVRWNVARAAFCTAAFGCLAQALTLFGGS
ncbi:MAG: DUF1772 domain-containing protein [Acidimicrobiia bacterium]|nr:DUF1772 domain-containing protein [Acidimicrobiia bacterium]